MKYLSTAGLSTAAIALAACLSVSSGAKADGPLIRDSAEFFKFDGDEFATKSTAVSGVNKFTPGSPDGALFYRKKIPVPAGATTLYVSIYTTGDAHGGSALWLSCRVNGKFCRPSVGGTGGEPSGWTSLLFPTADLHDNGVAYQWCVPIDEGDTTLTVDLKMASRNPGKPVFIEQGHVYIDSSRIDGTGRCVEAPLPRKPVVGASGTYEEVAKSAKHH